MGFIELLLIAVGVSMDAFAISICKGLSVEKVEKKHILAVGLWFGGAQALMPLIGYFLGSSFRHVIENVDHWLSFALLAIIGVNMIRESLGEIEKMDDCFGPRAMFVLSIADSIDALAVGVTFAFLEIQIVPAVTLIGITTFLFSALGILIGNHFGAKYKSRAEFAGGLILILIGISILLEHTGVL